MELKMSKTWKRVISFVLAFAMAFSFTPVTTSRAAAFVNATISSTQQDVDAEDLVYGEDCDVKWALTASDSTTALPLGDHAANAYFEVDDAHSVGEWNIEYAYDDGTGTETCYLVFDKDEVTNAGTYTAIVTYEYAPDGNTTYVATKNDFSVTVAKKEYTFKSKVVEPTAFGGEVDLEDLVEMDTFPYDDFDDANYEDVYDCVVATVEGFDGLPQDAGTYNVTLTGVVADNYKFVPATAKDATAGYTIKKDETEVTITGPLLSMTYDGTIPSLTIDGANIEVNGTAGTNANVVVSPNTLDIGSFEATIEFPNGTPTANVGKYNINLTNIKLDGETANVENNYANVSVVKGKITINKAFVTAGMSNTDDATTDPLALTKYTAVLDVNGDGSEAGHDEDDVYAFRIAHGASVPYVTLGNNQGDVSYSVYAYDSENKKFDIPDEIPYDLNAMPTTLETGAYHVFYKVNPSSNYKVSDIAAQDGVATEEERINGAPADFYIIVDKSNTSGNETITLDGWTYGDTANKPDVSQLDPSENVNKTTDVVYRYFKTYARGAGEDPLAGATPAVVTKSGEFNEDDFLIVPTMAGTYTVEAEIKYKDHNTVYIKKEFTIAPKEVKLFVEQPITLPSGVTFVDPEDPEDLDADEADVNKVKVSVQAADATAYSATESALVGKDKLDDNFAYKLEQPEGKEYVDFVANSVSEKTANYKVVGTNKGSITRATVSIEDAEVDYATNRYIEGVRTPIFEYSVRGVNNEEFELRAGGADLVEGTDYEITYQTYSGDARWYDEADVDETLLGGTNLDEVIETGTYAAIFTAKEGSKIVTAGTKKIVTFEVVKATLYAMGITAVDRVYDGTDVVEIKKTGKAANVYEPVYMNFDQHPVMIGLTKTNVVNIDKLILTGTVVDADGNETVTTSENGGKVYAQTAKVGDPASRPVVGEEILVDNKSIGLIIPDTEEVARNYEVVIADEEMFDGIQPLPFANVDWNETLVNIEPKPITVDFASATVSRPYKKIVIDDEYHDEDVAANYAEDAKVLKFKLAEGVENNELAPADLKTSKGVARTVEDAFATVNFPVVRYAKENATLAEQDAVDSIVDVTSTPIRVVFDTSEDAEVTAASDDNTLADKYVFNFKENAYTMLSITPVSLSDTARVAATLSDKTFETVAPATTVNAYELAEVVELDGTGVSEQTDVTFYAAQEDGKTANTSAPYSREAMKALPVGKYVARVVPAYGIKNFVDYVDVPFDVTTKKMIVELTPDAGGIVYDSKSKSVDKAVFTVKSYLYADGEYQLVGETGDSFAELFKEPDSFSFELATHAASESQAIKGTFDDGTFSLDLSQDIPAETAKQILTTTFNNKNVAIRFVIDGIFVDKAVEKDVKIKTTKVDLTPDNKDDEDVELASRWTYGDDEVVPETIGYVDEKDELGNNRKVTYQYTYLGSDLDDALEAIEDNNEDYDGWKTDELEAAEPDGWAGYYAVIGIVAEGTNYSNINTKAALVKIDKAPLRVYAKEGGKFFKESWSAEWPTYDTVEAEDLRADEAKEYATLTKTAAKQVYLDAMLDNWGGITIATDKDVDSSKLLMEDIETAEAGTYDIVPAIHTVDENGDDVINEHPICLNGDWTDDYDDDRDSIDNNYEMNFISAEYVIAPIDLAGDNVKATFVDEDGELLDIEGQDQYLDKNGKIIADKKGHRPKVQVTATFGEVGHEYDVVLVEGEDYNIAYKNAAGSEVTNPTEIGQYTIAVTAVPGKTTGTNNNAKFTITNSILIFEFVGTEGMTYGDEQYTANIKWVDDNKKTNVKILTAGSDEAVPVTDKQLKDIKTAVGGEDVALPIDYLSTDLDAGNAGKHTMKVDVSKLEAALGAQYAIDYVLTADENETKVPAVNVDIAQKDLAKATVSEEEGFDKTKVAYVPGGVTVDKFVKLVDGELLNPEHDYVCKYTANEAVGEATLTFNANDKQNSNYKGTVEYKFTIVKGSLANAVIEADSVPYSGAEQSFNWDTAKVYVVIGQDEEGKDITKPIVKDVDFTVVDDPTFPGKGTTIGTYPVKIQGKGNFDETTFAEGALEITPVELKVTGIVVTNRVYDGTTAVQWAGTAVLDKAARDAGWVLSGQPTAVVSESKDAGTHNVILEGYTLETTVDANKDRIDQYVLVPYTGTDRLTVEIATKEVKDFTGIKLADKEYDGSKKMTVEGTATLAGLLPGDDVTLTGFAETYEADDPNAGAKSVKIDPTTISVTGKDAKNYTYVKPELFELTGEIKKKAVTVSGLNLKEKTYDGTTDAEIEGTAKVDGAIAGETITFEPATTKVTIDSADAGERTFKISKEDIQAGLKGATKDNYYVAEDVAVTGKINPAVVTIDGAIKLADKEYDGIATMTVDASAATLTGVISADKNDVKIDIANQYAVGTSDAGDKTANIEVKLTGDKAKNYVLKKAEYTATGKITPKTVKASGLSLKKRVYDQTTTMALDGTNAKLEGLLAADEGKVTLAYPETVEVADKNAGEKTATVKVGLTQSANNYVLAEEDMKVSGTITKKGVTLADMKFKDKYYDGSKYMILTSTKGVITGGVLDGDDVAFETKQNNYVITGTKNAGSKKRKLTRGLWNVTGKDAANYQVAAGPTATGTIKKITVKKVTLKATSVKYTGKAQKPVIKSIVGDNGSKILQKNCKVQYYRNGKTTTDFKSKGTITVKVTGVGSADAKIGRNWTGSVSVKYTIK